MRVQGWYRDPYGRHGERWVSGGRPTALVRDDGAESYDRPPDAEPPVRMSEWEPVPEPAPPAPVPVASHWRAWVISVAIIVVLLAALTWIIGYLGLTQLHNMDLPAGH
jgi:hypothetical protein